MSNKKTLSAARKILSLLDNRDVAVIQTHLLQESFIGRIIRKKRTDIRHIFRAEVYPSDANPIWKKKIYYLFDKFTSQLVDCYVANGKYLSDEIITCSSVNPKRVFTLLNGRDTIGLPDEPVKALDKPLPAKVAMRANFIPGKRHECLIRAISSLKKKNLIVQVRLIGGEITPAAGSKKQSHISLIKKTAESLGVSNQVEFYGYSKNVFRAIEGIPVIVLPSCSAMHHREGIPNCILETMSLRKLIVASDIGGVSEIIEHGKSGILHKPQDYVGLADCLEGIFTAPAANWENMRNAAFKNWSQKFTLDIMINNLVEIYKKIGLIKS
ncbi:MAG: glycosyltransferase [Phycisphaerae bacterium]|nr:glycosyltransferase [Phycisphaerae bacterium]